MKNLLLLSFCLALSVQVKAQDDLLDRIDKSDTNADAIAAFKGIKIVNFESTKLLSKKEFYFVVSHRFGSISNGFDDFFGLDFANTRLQFIYGVSDNFNIGTSRSSFNKTYELSLKYRLLQQDGRTPVTVAGYSQGAINTELDEALIGIPIDFSDRLSFTQQVLISRKFNDKLSLQLMPTFFYEGFVDYAPQDNAQYALGIGGRYKLGPRWSLNVDYGWHLNRADGSPFKNPLSIGVDIETGGHVFQLHFTNAQPTFESGFLGNAVGDWGEGIVYFGFNLVRVFNF
ncbi:hypothetical protein SAMN04490243_0043 [Robiginitalea myxolifaciens]|uniref:DUF5777 domain-containing protein n=1 Tax=Robiginitalea myxolifaciens TaxID=400055 RepID=A0A1I6FMQ1_9FLAO|nr:DUF5777 family beta-barrel protein [Robiginitalea myxolifaciens]SFR31216.1 hypothetical protein SAMN04490243_0043 [Robiginitalea myxolifaciens]